MIALRCFAGISRCVRSIIKKYWVYFFGFLFTHFLWDCLMDASLLDRGCILWLVDPY